MNKRILITGVAGHIGSQLAAEFVRLGCEVYGIDDLSCGYLENVPDEITFYTQNADCFCLLNQQFDVVYHLAAYAAECMSPFVRRFNYYNNLINTTGIVSDMCAVESNARLVFASSIAAYGDASGWDPPFDEDMDCTPHDPYGIAKHACELDIQVAGEQHGLDWCIVRPHNVFGPYQSIWQRYRNVLGLWMRAALEGQPITVFGDGEQRRAFSYIDDTVAALVEAGTRPEASGQIINVGGKRDYSINELVNVFKVVVGDIPVRREPPRHEIKHAWCTTEKSEKLLGYRDSVQLEDGVGRMWEWARKAWDAYPERRKEGKLLIECRKGLPQSWE